MLISYSSKISPLALFFEHKNILISNNFSGENSSVLREICVLSESLTEISPELKCMHYYYLLLLLFFRIHLLLLLLLLLSLSLLLLLLLLWLVLLIFINIIYNSILCPTKQKEKRLHYLRCGNSLPSNGNISMFNRD